MADLPYYWENHMFLLAQLPAEVLSEQLGNGLALMALGMGIVFVFLTILVFTTKAVSAVVKKLEPKEKTTLATTNEAEIAVAILAAERRRLNDKEN